MSQIPEVILCSLCSHQTSSDNPPVRRADSTKHRYTFNKSSVFANKSTVFFHKMEDGNLFSQRAWKAGFSDVRKFTGNCAAVLSHACPIFIDIPAQDACNGYTTRSLSFRKDFAKMETTLYFANSPTRLLKFLVGNFWIKIPSYRLSGDR